MDSAPSLCFKYFALRECVNNEGNIRSFEILYPSYVFDMTGQSFQCLTPIKFYLIPDPFAETGGKNFQLFAILGYRSSGQLYSLILQSPKNILVG